MFKGILPEKYFHSNISFFVSVELFKDHETFTALRRTWLPSASGDIAGFKTMLCDIMAWATTNWLKLYDNTAYLIIIIIIMVIFKCYFSGELIALS